jgi:hypothetical protein
VNVFRAVLTGEEVSKVAVVRALCRRLCRCARRLLNQWKLSIHPFEQRLHRKSNSAASIGIEKDVVFRGLDVRVVRPSRTPDVEADERTSGGLPCGRHCRYERPIVLEYIHHSAADRDRAPVDIGVLAYALEHGNVATSSRHECLYNNPVAALHGSFARRR